MITGTARVWQVEMSAKNLTNAYRNNHIYYVVCETAEKAVELTQGLHEGQVIHGVKKIGGGRHYSYLRGIIIDDNLIGGDKCTHHGK